MRRSARRVVAAALAAGALLAAGCGGGDDDAPAGADLTALRCPLAATGEEAGGTQQYAPAENSFDTAELIGDALADAERTAAEHGCTIVVAMEDGAGVPVPTDIDPTRIYVYTEDDVVTEIEGVGGGL